MTDGATNKNKKGKLRIALIIMLLFIPFFIGLLHYFRVQGFKETLITLVENETNGTHLLSIGKTDIQYLELSFSLNDIAVLKVDPIDSTGILEVRSKQLKVSLGSLISLLFGEQYEIKELSITEPVARVGIMKKEENEAQTDPVNIAHEVAQFLPAIRSLLNQFDIKLFRIDRAEVDLYQSQSQIEIRMMDLWVSEWNMRNLSQEATFKWSLGPQSIAFSNAEFGFNSIVYDYQTNELALLDYKFKQADSLGRTVLDVKGDSIQIIDLDFQTLIKQEHYIFNTLTISKPTIKAFIYPHEKKEHRAKYPIANLLKRNLGKLQIVNTKLENARLDLMVYGDRDTLSVHLPNVNLETKDIAVSKDSSTVMIDALKLELDKTYLEPGGALSLEFSKLRYDKHYNLEIDSIELLDQDTGKELITCEYLKLFNFDFFHYYYENDIIADSLLLKNGKIVTRHGAPKLRRVNESNSVGGKRKEPPTLHVAKVKMDGIDLELNLEQSQLQAENITAVLEDLVREDHTSYQLRYLGSPELTYSDSEDEIQVEVDQVVYQQNSLQVDKLDGHYHGLVISLDGFKGHLKKNFSLNKPWHYQLNSIELENIDLTGMLDGSQNTQAGASPDLALQKVRLGQFKLDLKFKDTHRFAIEGSNLVADTPQFVNNKLALKHAQVALQMTSFESDQVQLSMGSSMVRSDSNSLLTDLRVHLDSTKYLRADQIELGPWQKQFESILVDHLLLSQLEYQETAGTKSTADSIRLQDLSWTEDQQPVVDKLKIFGPDLYFNSGNGSKTTHGNERTIAPLSMIGETMIGPGKVTMDDHEISFQEIALFSEEEREEIRLKGLAFQTPKSSLHVNQVWTTKSDLNIDTITIVPKQEYIEQIDTERDVGAGQIYHTQIRNLNWNMLIDSNMVIAKDILINGFDLSIKRDKTLPDPEHLTKPFLLTDMMPVVPRVSIPRIIIQNGNISYHEVGEKTGKEGRVALNDINLTFDLPKSYAEPSKVLQATAKLYDQGMMQVQYHQMDSGRFSLNARLTDFPLEDLNQMVVPLEAAKIESGHISNFETEVLADSATAVGTASISYDNLHVRFFKKGTPDERNIGSDLLTLMVDHIILKHSKTNASADFTRDRIIFKGPINYWVKIALKGGLAAVRKGKQHKSAKR